MPKQRALTGIAAQPPLGCRPVPDGGTAARVEDRESHLPVGKLRGELLGRLLAEYATTDPTVIVGPGTGGDAAAIAVGDATIVVKSDPITFTSQNPARYLVDVNANDLACLGARPRWLMVTALLAEGRTTGAQVEAHFRA